MLVASVLVCVSDFIFNPMQPTLLLTLCTAQCTGNVCCLPGTYCCNEAGAGCESLDFIANLLLITYNGRRLSHWVDLRSE